MRRRLWRWDSGLTATATDLACDLAESLPLILNNGVNSYIYGPGGLPVEQIKNTTSTVLYLHHDQQGSTRLLTGSTGKAEATVTYDAYGNKAGSTEQAPRRWATTANTPTRTPASSTCELASTIRSLGSS